MHRYFEFAGGTSAKYWEVDLHGCDVTVRYGRIGSFGQFQTKTFPDPEAARNHVDKLIAEKSAKGYREPAVAQ
jgi:predicted DNA-binding WGR domain protein